MKKLLIFFYIFLLVSFLGLSGCVSQTSENGMLRTDSNRSFQSAKIHTALAAEYFDRGQYEVAIEEVSTALKAQSNYAPAYNVLGLIKMTLNEDNKALESFEKAVRLAPKNSEIHNNFGWFLCQRFPQRLDQAIDHFMIAAQDPLYQTPEMSYTNAAICDLKRQKYSDAQFFLQRALSIQPNYIPALIAIIEVDFRQGNLIEAKSKFTHFLNHYSPTAEALLLAMQIEQALGDQLAADSYFFQLQKHFPDSKEAIAARRGTIRP